MQSAHPALAELAAQSGTSPETMQKMALLQKLMGQETAANDHDAERRRKRQKMAARIRQLQEEHIRQRARLDALAEALGACYCWGEETDCRACRGRGQPGATAPDMDRFEEFVLPLLLRLGLVSDDDVVRNPDGDEHEDDAWADERPASQHSTEDQGGSHA